MICYQMKKNAIFMKTIILAVLFCILLIDSALGIKLEKQDDFINNSKKAEVFLDAQHREQRSRNGIDDAYSEQDFLRYTLRYGFTVSKYLDLTPYFRLHGVHSWSDTFSFINNIEPGVGIWARPLRPFLNGKNSICKSLFRNIRTLIEYSPNTYYLDDPESKSDPEGNLLRLSIDWYGEHGIKHEFLTGYMDLFSQYRLSENGPKEILHWSLRPGIAIDKDDMRLRLYLRWNGSFGFDSREPWNNVHEFGGGLALQPFYVKQSSNNDSSMLDKWLSNIRIYIERLSLSYMNRNNDLYLSSQPESYIRFGIELWYGRE